MDGAVIEVGSRYPNRTGVAVVWVPTVNGFWTWRIANFPLAYVYDQESIWNFSSGYFQYSNHWSIAQPPSGTSTTTRNYDDPRLIMRRYDLPYLIMLLILVRV